MTIEDNVDKFIECVKMDKPNVCYCDRHTKFFGGHYWHIWYGNYAYPMASIKLNSIEELKDANRRIEKIVPITKYNRYDRIREI